MTIYSKTKGLSFDPRDLMGNLTLMDRADDFEMPFFGENEDGEHVVISINTDNITQVTYQHNNWIRTNIYHRDGRNEELFSR